MPSELPILIAGAGPVGLAVAVALQRASIPVVVFDPRAAIPRDPRATTLQPAGLQALARLRVAQPLVERGLKVERLQYWDWRSHTLLAELDYGLIAADTAFPYRLHVPQWVVCEELLGRLKRGTVRWRHRVVGFEDLEDDGVLVEVRHDGVRESCRGRLLVGADGLNSTVRQELGVELETGSRDTFLTCEVDSSVVEHLPSGAELGPCAHLFDAGAWVVWMQLRDSVRLLFHVDGDPTDAMTDAAVWRRATHLLGADGAESFGWDGFRSRATYTVNQRLAASMHKGCVLLAGDAAHSAFPVGGMAMNAGLLDAVALADAVIDGSEAALRAYGAERRAEVSSTLLVETAEAHDTLGARGLFARWSRNRQIGALADDPDEARAHLQRLSML